ncbi:hypothetical protein J3B02_006142 [Coemansia erecta]|nr:hypothetical protein J3B02_006142 [Coemansia erecta]KAJ2872874.1 hypothetical protein FB639_004285 [Coemansia asiatica]
MFVRIASASSAAFVVAALVCATLGLSADAQPVDNANQGHGHAHAIARRSPCNSGFVGGGFFPCGCNGFFPFAFNNVNAFNRNAFCAHCNDDTLFENHKNANVAANNVNAFNSANVIA